MASTKNALAMCDICGFVYPHRVMRLNSYGMLVCPEDYEGQYDLKIIRKIKYLMLETILQY